MIVNVHIVFPWGDKFNKHMQNLDALTYHVEKQQQTVADSWPEKVETRPWLWFFVFFIHDIFIFC